MCNLISTLVTTRSAEYRGISRIAWYALAASPILTFAFLFLLSAGVWSSIRSAQALQAHKASTTATVTGVSWRRSTWTVSYSFVDATGKARWGKDHPDHWARGRDRTTVYYHPADPSINTIDLAQATRILERQRVVLPILLGLLLLGPVLCCGFVYVVLQQMIARRHPDRITPATAA